MSNETLDEAGVLREVQRARGPGAGPAHADRRHGRQRSGRAEGRAQDRREVARAIRVARQHHRACARDSRRRRRQPARALSTGCRRAASCSPSRPIANCRCGPTDLALDAAGRRGTEADVRALRIQELAARHSGRGRRPGRAPTPSRKRAANDTAGRRWDTNVADASAVVAGPRRPSPRTTRWCATRPHSRAGWRPSTPRNSSRFDTETTSLDPMQARIVGVSLAIAPGQRVLHPARRTAMPARRTSSTATRTLRRLAPWLADPTKRKLGQNLKYDQHAFANDGLALRGVAHDTLLESYVLESHKPHDMGNLAWRHLNLTTHQLRRRDRQGRQAHSVRAGGHRPRDRVLGRGRRHHAAPASRAPAGDRRRREARVHLRADRDAGARSAVPHGAQRHPHRLAACSRSRAANWASA